MSPNKTFVNSNICPNKTFVTMLIYEEYSRIYVKEQLFYLLFLAEIFNDLENLISNPKAFQDALTYRFLSWNCH